jgi:hypothetical protein
MGCTYSAPRYTDSANNKPRLVFVDPTEINQNKQNDNQPTNVVNNKSKKILKKLYGF